MLYNDCQGGSTTAIARHVSFAQITCTGSVTIQQVKYCLTKLATM